MKGISTDDRVAYLVEVLSPYYERELEHRKNTDAERWAIADLLAKEKSELDTPELFRTVEAQLPWGHQTLLKRRRTAECWSPGDRKPSASYSIHELLALAAKLSQTKRRKLLGDSCKHGWRASQVRTEIARALRPTKPHGGSEGSIGPTKVIRLVDERWLETPIVIRYTPTLGGAEIHVEGSAYLNGGDLSLERNPS